MDSRYYNWNTLALLALNIYQPFMISLTNTRLFPPFGNKKSLFNYWNLENHETKAPLIDTYHGFAPPP